LRKIDIPRKTEDSTIEKRLALKTPGLCTTLVKFFSDFPSSLDLFVKLLRSIAIIPTAIMQPVTSLAVHQQLDFFSVIQYGSI
jgi:hypothetical protein